jgi:hypothetical protein
MDPATITRYITGTLDGVDFVVAGSDAFFFYDPGGDTPPDRRLPFATIVTSDAYDDFSDLDRPSVYRLNFGVGRETFRSLFGTASFPDDADEVAASSYDFTVLDRILPHPVYGKMFWVCVLSPSPETFAAVKPLLAEAHERAAGRHAKTRQRDES